MTQDTDFDFSAYQEAFNSGDDERALEFWDDELHVTLPIGPDRVGLAAKNKAEFRAFLAHAHQGVREVMRLQSFLQSGAQIFAEIDMDFFASEDKPDFAFGPMKAGEFITVRMFGLYTVRDNRLWQLRMAFWPPNQEVSEPPAYAVGVAPPSLGPATRAQITSPLEESARNKQVIEDFVREVPHGGNLDALDILVAENYIQHNPRAGQGREGVRQFFDKSMVDLDRDIHSHPSLYTNLIAEGEFVVRQEMRENGMLIDVWRVRDGQMQEHWDAWRPAEGYERAEGF